MKFINNETMLLVIRYLLPILLTELYNLVSDLTKGYFRYRVRVPRFMYVTLFVHPLAPYWYMFALVPIAMLSGLEDTGI